MSGGAFDYIHLKTGAEFLNLEDSNIVESLSRLTKQLKTYGAAGERALAETGALLAQVEGMRAQIEVMSADINRKVSLLYSVWREADYHVCFDSGKDDVLKVLGEFNGDTPATGQAAL